VAKPKVKPKEKRAPKKKVMPIEYHKHEDILEELKKIYERLDKIEGDILVLQGIVQPQATPLEKKEASE